MKKRFIVTLLSLVFLLGMACPALAEEPAEPAAAAQDEAAPMETEQPASAGAQDNLIVLEVGEYTFFATLEENSTGEALKEKLAEAPVTIIMRDYGSMEKVGGFGFELPRNDESIVTEPGDLILFQGSAFVIYYAPNSWNFTRIGNCITLTQRSQITVM